MINFDDDDLATKLDGLDAEALHTLPFGVIRIDDSEHVRFFSRTEARQSGRGERATVGLAYFDEVAPCMANDGMKGRLEEERRSGTLDIEIGHVGDFDDPERYLRVRAMSAAAGGIWFAHLRE